MVELTYRRNLSPGRPGPLGVSLTSAGVRGIFRPCSRMEERVHASTNAVFRPVEVKVVATNSTATIVSFSSCPDVWTFGYSTLPYCREAGSYACQAWGYENALSEALSGEQREEGPNIVEFRSLPPRIASLSTLRGRLRVSPSAAEYAHARRGRTLRIESNLEEEPE